MFIHNISCIPWIPTSITNIEFKFAAKETNKVIVGFHTDEVFAITYGSYCFDDTPSGIIVNLIARIVEEITGGSTTLSPQTSMGNCPLHC